MQFIPLAQNPNQTLNVILDGQDCTLSVYWRQERLYLDLAVNEVPLVAGAICENRANVLQSELLDFKGSLHFFDNDGDRPPRVEGLGENRWFFVFVPASETLPESLRF